MEYYKDYLFCSFKMVVIYFITRKFIILEHSMQYNITVKKIKEDYSLFVQDLIFSANGQKMEIQIIDNGSFLSIVLNFS